MDKRLFWVSLFLHFALIFLIDFSSRNLQINKQFVALGRHSKMLSHAYFRNFNSSKFNYQKYLKLRWEKEKADRAKISKKKKKKIVKKKAVKKSPTKLVKKDSKKTKPKTLSKPKPKPKPKAKPKEKPKPKIQKEVENREKEKEIEIETEFEELYFNLLGEVDPKIIMYQQAIQREVDRIWRPPLGAPKGIECVVRFEIEKNGSVKNFKIEKSSKMLIYDLSIVRVGKEFKFEKCLWGKSFTINFRQ